MWLVGNGEVYNHEDVRASLHNAPYRPSPTTRWRCTCCVSAGPHALDELEGMFAFLAATEEGNFLAARDAVGIKPLYWAEDDGRVVLRVGDRRLPAQTASAGGVLPARPSVDARGRARALRRRRAGRRPRRRRGPAASRPRLRPHRDARDADQLGAPPDDGRRARRRVPLRRPGLEPDRRHRRQAAWPSEGETLQTFAVGTEGSSDIIAARRVAEHIGSEHHERIYDAEEAVAVVPEVVRAIEHFDPSLVRSAVPNYLLAEMTVGAREGGAHRRGRRRAVRRLRVPAQDLEARASCTTRSCGPSRSCTTSTCSAPTGSRWPTAWRRGCRSSTAR